MFGIHKEGITHEIRDQCRRLGTDDPWTAENVVRNHWWIGLIRRSNERSPGGPLVDEGVVDDVKVMPWITRVNILFEIADHGAVARILTLLDYIPDHPRGPAVRQIDFIAGVARRLTAQAVIYDPVLGRP